MGKRWLFLGFVMMVITAVCGFCWGAGKEFSVKAADLNYRYQVDYSGWVIDFSDPALNLNEKKAANQGAKPKIPRKVMIELKIESIYGGFDWLPMNPVISDDANHTYSDYKVIIAPQAGDSLISVKYLITGVSPDMDSLAFFEEGLSQDGKKAYRLSLRNIPVQ